MPASLTWQGNYSDQFADAQNWLPDQLPAAGDDISFDGSVSNNSIANFGPAPPGGGGLPGPSVYNSVNLVNGYTGTVTVSLGFETEALTLTSGSISQVANPNMTSRDIHVLEDFTWTGGVLNNSTDHSTLHLLGGSTATITPPGVDELVTGSTLSFEINAQGAAAQGTVNPGRSSLTTRPG